MRIVFIICSVFFLFSCKNDASSGDILSKKKMQAVLWDVIQADVYVNQFVRSDSTKNDTVENIKLQQQIFARHKITKESFYKSYAYYQSHPNDMQAILDSMSVEKSRTDKAKYLKPLLKHHE